MDRRAFLSAATTGFAAATAGCMGAENEPCTASFVPLDEIHMSAIRSEVEIALEEGEYAAYHLGYPEHVTDDSTLWDRGDNRYYEHNVDESLLKDVLTFEEVTPTREQPVELKLSNQTDSSFDASATIAVDGGEAVVNSEFTVEPTDTLNEVDRISPDEYVGGKGAMQRAPGVEFPAEMRDYEVTLDIDSNEVTLDTDSNEVTPMTDSRDSEASGGAICSVTPWMEYLFVQVGSDGVLSGVIRENDNAFFATDVGHSKEGVHWECADLLTGWPGY